VKFKSQIFTQASGSVGGLTFSRNRGGLYTRSRTIPVNPSTAQQITLRGIFTQLTNFWSSVLTDAQRVAWATYATNVPLTDRLGDPIIVSGFNMYIRSNVPRVQAGLLRSDNAPTTFNLGQFTNVFANTVELGQVLQIAFTNTDDWANEGQSALLVYSGRPLSPTINFFKGPYRFVTAIEGDAVTPPTSPATLTAAFTPITDAAMYVRVRVSRNDGRLSGEQVIRTVSS
jgi:hypothetical protein